MAGLIRERNYSQNLGTAGLNVTTDFDFNFEVQCILFKTAGTATETFTVTYDSPAGSTYDTVLGQQELSSGTSAAWHPSPMFSFAQQGQLTITSTNATSTMLYVTVIVKEI